MMCETLVGAGVLLCSLLGVASSNYLFDRGVDHYLAQRSAAILGGLAYFIAILGLDPWSAVYLSGFLTLAILALRVGYRSGLRGITGSFSHRVWPEITYPLVGTFSLVIGWALLDDKWLAFVPIGFMAWGDSVAGLARSTISRADPRGTGPSLAMLAMCLVVALAYQPYWIGASGAVAATAVERFRPTNIGLFDDNLLIIVGAFSVMLALINVGS